MSELELIILHSWLQLGHPKATATRWVALWVTKHFTIHSKLDIPIDWIMMKPLDGYHEH